MTPSDSRLSLLALAILVFAIQEPLAVAVAKMHGDNDGIVTVDIDPVAQGSLSSLNRVMRKDSDEGDGEDYGEALLESDLDAEKMDEIDGEFHLQVLDQEAFLDSKDLQGIACTTFAAAATLPDTKKCFCKFRQGTRMDDSGPPGTRNLAPPAAALIDTQGDIESFSNDGDEAEKKAQAPRAGKVVISFKMDVTDVSVNKTLHAMRVMDMKALATKIVASAKAKFLETPHMEVAVLQIDSVKQDIARTTTKKAAATTKAPTTTKAPVTVEVVATTKAPITTKKVTTTTVKGAGDATTTTEAGVATTTTIKGGGGNGTIDQGAGSRQHSRSILVGVVGIIMAMGMQ